MTIRSEKIANYCGSGHKGYRLSSKETSFRFSTKNTFSTKEMVLEVSESAGRIMNIEYNGQKVIWSNPNWFVKLPGILAKGKEQGRKAVSWDDVNTLGGEKTFVAPQDLYDGMVPFIEPNLGLFSSRDILNGVQLTSPICRESGFQVVNTIRLTGPSSFEIEACALNRSRGSKTAAPWIVFQLPVPAVVSMSHLVGAPEAFKAFGERLPENVLTTLAEDSFALSLRPGGSSFKAGYNFMKGPENLRPRITASFPDKNINMSFEVKNIEGPFPHGYRVETYACDRYFEQEFLGPLEKLASGRSSKILKVKCTLSSIA